MTFEETYLNDNILDALYDMHFEDMTPIQERCIPEILDGFDVLGIAQTGTGKTAAYLLPILSQLDDGGYPKDAINCIIMSPTRELAQQIDQAMQGFGYYLNDVSSVAVYGGNDGNRYDQELRSMRMGADVLIATPGRLLSHLKVGNLDLSRCSFFVLDEADRMLDMGFVDDIMKIVQQLPQNCQRIMFSATMPKKIRELAVQLLHDPVEVQIAVSRPAEKIRQMAYVCYEPQKLQIIQHIFKNGNLQRVIIFSGKKERVKEVTRKLKSMHINCDQMHSDLSQAERDEAMYRFKAGQTDVLVATDIVARGIDIDDIRLVINYDVPTDSEDYVHRIGRTARADRDGEAITFVSDTDIYRFQSIEHFLGKEVEKMPLPEGLGDAPEYVKRPKKGNTRKGNGRWHSHGHGGHGKKRKGNKSSNSKNNDVNKANSKDQPRSERSRKTS
jgi:superfamily II DNA/RNA helicase